MPKKQFNTAVRYQWGDLQKLYVEDGLNCAEIARLKGCTRRAVRLALQSLGIALKSREQSIRRGPEHSQFKSGRNPDGYCHSKSGGKRAFIHRRVAEQVLGRPLSRSERVHHSNGRRDDNLIHNLWVFPSQSAHGKFHRSGIIHPDTIFLAAVYVLSFGLPLLIKEVSYVRHGG